jgi:hypothetical protein
VNGFVQERQRGIACGDLTDGQRPADGGCGIGVVQAAGEFRHVGGGHHVEDFAVRLEHLETMSETAGHIDLTAAIRGKFKTLPLTKSSGAGPHIYEHIKNAPGSAADEFDLRRGFRLPVHASDGSHSAGAGLIALRPCSIQTGAAKLIFTVGAGEEAPFIAPRVQFHHNEAVQSGGMKFHAE